MSPAAPQHILGARTAAWSAAGLTALFAVATVLVGAGWSPLLRLDDAVARWAYQATAGNEAWLAWWIAVDRVTEPILLRILLVGIGLVLAWRRRWALAGWLVAVTVVQNLVAGVVKHILDRPRPRWPAPLALEDSTSFPAGHSAGVALFATAVILVALATAGSRGRRWSVAVTAVAAAVVVSLDRIYLGLHYVSDVVAGILLGVAVPLAGWAVMVGILRARARRTGEPWHEADDQLDALEGDVRLRR
ncbi:MAG TPA: phosphatase PAP2 family protein [Nocardioidaceae bacterium]|nr:phosphatase PAP2 family protein [Nocardioidaceae bacterium]